MRFLTVRRTRSLESGAVLILALVFLLVVAVLILAISNFAVEAATNTTNLRTQRSLESNAEGAATAAIQNVRLNYGASQYGSVFGPTITWSNPVSCLPAGYPTSPTVAVWCKAYAIPDSPTTRVVDFYVCPPTPGVTAATCTALNSQYVQLYAEVVYDDLPPGSVATACNAATNATCGLTVNINPWDVRIADS